MIAPSDLCPVTLQGGRRCNRPMLHTGPHRTCWRCGGLGFIRKPCQGCGLWRTSAGELVYMAGSVWGDSAPPMKPKTRRKGADW